MTVGSTKSVSRFLNNATNEVNKSNQRMASGSRVNKSSDDAAAQAIIAALGADAATLEVATRNVGYGNSIANIADSAMSGLSDITNRMSELAAQAANGTYSDAQRAQMQEEYDALAQEAQRTVETANFNGRNVFSDNSITIQAGTDGSSNSQIAIEGVDIRSAVNSLSSVDLTSQASARNALDTVSTASNEISSARGQVGATVSRLNTAAENNESRRVEELEAQSAMRDVDIAEESARNVSSRIREQASVAIMAQANQSSTVVQQLLG